MSLIFKNQSVSLLTTMEEHSLIDLQLKTPFCMVISGSTQCGKSTLVQKILERREELFDKPIHQIVYCYSLELKIFSELQHKVPGIKFQHGLPTNIDDLNIGSSLLILDDLMQEISNSKEAIDLFTKSSHHQNISVIFITQNFFFKNLRNLTTQCKYICIMKNPRENSHVKTISRQMNQGLKNPAFEQAYNHVMSVPYGHLFLDFDMNQIDNYRIRTSVFPDPDDCIVFVS